MNVTDRQCLLKFLKRTDGTRYYAGQVDGISGPLTVKAAEDFQRDFGLAAGTAKDETDIAMRHAVAYGMPEREPAADNNAGDKTGSFWDHIRYWKREEFRCRCGGKYCNGFPAEPNQTLVELVDDIRHKAGRPGIPSSGLRCKTWNSIQGGVSNSRHLSGKALDFSVEGVSGSKLLSLAQADPRTRYAYIIDGGWVHVDVE